MRIWIVGDSWGAPNYFMPMPDWRAGNHISELLADNGYHVVNFSQAGRDNHRNFAKINIHQTSFIGKPDVIIWFHTSMVRDYSSHMSTNESIKNLDQLHEAAEITYKYASKTLQDNGNPLLIFIGGHAPCVEPEFSKYFKPYIKIDNLRSFLIGKPLPNPPFVSETHFLQHLDISLDKMDRLVSEIETVHQAMSESGLFPDHSHPGDRAHRILFNYLKPILEDLDMNMKLRSGVTINPVNNNP